MTTNRPAARAIDPISLAVVRGRIESIAEEMQHALTRSSFSSVIKEAGDASSALFDTKGQCLAQATGVAILLGTLLSAIRSMLDVFPVESMREGDIYLMNDPYAGGTHIPDIILFSPICVDGRPVALSCTIAHHRDLGGRTPGSTPVDATEIFQEGLRLPPVQLYAAGVRNQALFDVMRANTRLPRNVEGDLDAQIGACRLGERRFIELVAEYGADAIADMMAELLDMAEELTRRELAALPAGRYEFEDYLDNDGVELDRLIPVKVAVTLGGGTIHVDFTGTSRQLRGPFNATTSTTTAACFFVVRSLTDPSVPTNSGCLRPIGITAPEGSAVNALHPSPVNSRSAMFHAIIQAMFGALAKAAPQKIPACGYDFPIVNFGGFDPARKAAFVFSELGTGGFGARPHRDGIDVFRSKGGNVSTVPVEANEMDFPVRVVEFGMRPDSGGAGRFRGGLGYVKVYESLVDNMTASVRAERHRTAPWGLEGGGPGANSVTRVLRRDGTSEEVPSKKVVRLDRGDRLVLMSAGGGGHGDPCLRERALLARDIANGKVTIEAARRLYGLGHDEALSMADGMIGA